MQEARDCAFAISQRFDMLGLPTWLVFVGLALGILALWSLRRRSGNVTLSV
jgi:hypothetical protein